LRPSKNSPPFYAYTNTINHNITSYVSGKCTVLASKRINNPLTAGLRGSVTGFRGGRRGKGKGDRKGSEDMEGIKEWEGRSPPQ